MKNLLTIGKIMGVWGFLIMALFLFQAGRDATRHWYFQMTLDFLLAGFGAAFMGLQISESIMKAVMHSHEKDMAAIDELSKNLIRDLDKAFDKHFDPEMQKNYDALTEVLDTMGYGNKAPEQAALNKIAAAFHAETGKYVKLRLENDGLSSEFSDTPFATTTKKTTKIPVTHIEDKPVARPKGRSKDAIKAPAKKKKG